METYINMDSIRVGREEEFRVLVKQLEDINDSIRKSEKGLHWK